MLDRNVLEDLRQVMADELPLLLETYLGELAAFPLELEASTKADDAERLRRIAHSLKGSSRNLGAQELAALLQRLELHAANEDLAQARVLVEPVLEQCSRAEAAARAALCEIQGAG